MSPWGATSWSLDPWPRSLPVVLITNAYREQHALAITKEDGLIDLMRIGCGVREAYGSSNSWLSNLRVRAFSVTVRWTSSAKPESLVASISSVIRTSVLPAFPS